MLGSSLSGFTLFPATGDAHALILPGAHRRRLIQSLSKRQKPGDQHRDLDQQAAQAIRGASGPRSAGRLLERAGHTIEPPFEARQIVPANV